MTLRRDPIPSPNYSTRGGSSVRLVVLHTTQGASNYRELGNYFANPSSGVSSHVGIDDTPGVVGEYVRADYKAWTQGDANPVAIAAELCAWAEWSPSEWAAHPAMLDNAAQWVAEECARFGLPIRALTAGEAQGGGRGVCQHADLGGWGGGHWDCGGGFPMAQVIERAAGGAPPAPEPERRNRNMIASTATGEGYWCVTHDGAVYAYGDAQSHGGPFSPDLTQPGVEIVGIAGKGNDGYWVYASDGSVFAYGSAVFMGRPDRF